MKKGEKDFFTGGVRRRCSSVKGNRTGASGVFSCVPKKKGNFSRWAGTGSSAAKPSAWNFTTAGAARSTSPGPKPVVERNRRGDARSSMRSKHVPRPEPRICWPSMGRQSSGPCLRGSSKKVSGPNGSSWKTGNRIRNGAVGWRTRGTSCGSFFMMMNTMSFKVKASWLCIGSRWAVVGGR